MNFYIFIFVLTVIGLPAQVFGESCQRVERRRDYTKTCGSKSVSYPYCTPGKKLTDPCTGSCDYCTPGSYQDLYTDCLTCLPCTTIDDCCEDQVLVIQCESDRNAQCGCKIPDPPAPCPTSVPASPVELEFTQSCPSDLEYALQAGSSSKQVTWTEPSVSIYTEVVRSHSPGNNFSIGSTAVYYSFTNSTGGLLTCSFVVTVHASPVELEFTQSCPSDLEYTLQARSSTKQVNWIEPSVSNYQEVVQSHSSGDHFSIGSTAVYFSFTNSIGGVLTCSFVVIVHASPVKLEFTQSCPPDVNDTVQAGSSSKPVKWTEPSVSNYTVVVQSHSPGDYFSIGSTAVSYSFTNSTGGVLTCSFVVIILEASGSPSTNKWPEATQHPSSKCEDPSWIVWVIIVTTLIVFIFIVAYGILYYCRYEGIKKICPHAHDDNKGRNDDRKGRYGEKVPMIIRRNSQEANVNVEGTTPKGAEGGVNVERTTPEGGVNDIQTQDNTDGPPTADSGDQPNEASQKTGKSGLCVNMDGPTAKGASGDFSDPNAGDQYVENDLGDFTVKFTEEYYRRKIKSLGLLFNQLGIPESVSTSILCDNANADNETKIYEVLIGWHRQKPQTRKTFLKALKKFDNCKKTHLAKWYLNYVNTPED